MFGLRLRKQIVCLLTEIFMICMCIPSLPDLIDTFYAVADFLFVEITGNPKIKKPLMCGSERET